jgi:hypothetical protein
MIDVTEARRLVREMAQGQKLESVGRIAAGVAHEINTSVQFISDSVRFVRHALRDVPHALAITVHSPRRPVGQGRDRRGEEGLPTPTKRRTSTTSSRTHPTRSIAPSRALAAWAPSCGR